MLYFPTKLAAATSDELANGLTAVIRTTYGSFAATALISDSVAMRRAREAAVGKKVSNETEAAAAEDALVLYGALLELLQDKLGMEVREQRAMGFAWQACWDGPSEKTAPTVQHAPIAERAAVLFNLGACWSMRAAMPPRTDSEAIKAAARHFQLAAGALQACQQLGPQAALGEACSPELTDAALKAIQALMTAQAQACFCEKAASDGLGTSTQVKLFLGAKQLYTLAADALAALKASKPHAKLYTWGAAVCEGRKQWLEAEARWQASLEAAAANKYGVQQAQLHLASAAAASASQLLASAELESPSALSKLQTLAARAAATLAQVAKDNDTIYNEKVPAAALLPEVEPKVLAKPLPIDGLFASAKDAPFPLSVLRVGEEGSGELLRSWLSRLDAEFTMVPLSEREDSSCRPAGGAKSGGSAGHDAGTERSRGAQSVKADGGSGSRLSNFFGKGADESSAKGVSSAEKKADGADKKAGFGELFRGGSFKAASGGGASVKIKGSNSSKGAGNSANDDLDDEAALQKALAESLKESEKELFRGAKVSYPSSPRSAPDKELASRPPPPSGPPKVELVAPVSAAPPRDVLKKNNLADSPPLPPTSYASGGSIGGGGWGGGLPPPPSFDEAATMPSPAAFEEMVRQLQGMGFPRERCVGALREAKYDVSAACDRLLS